MARPDEPLLLGVRHHGPGSARAVRAVLDAYEPPAVLIEGPPEADALAPLVCEEGMRPPVALLAHVAGSRRARPSGRWPSSPRSGWLSAGRWSAGFRSASSISRRLMCWPGRSPAVAGHRRTAAPGAAGHRAVRPARRPRAAPGARAGRAGRTTVVRMATARAATGPRVVQAVPVLRVLRVLRGYPAGRDPAVPVPPVGTVLPVARGSPRFRAVRRGRRVRTAPGLPPVLRARPVPPPRPVRPRAPGRRLTR